METTKLKNIWNSKYAAPLTEPLKLIGRGFRAVAGDGYGRDMVKAYRGEMEYGGGRRAKALFNAWKAGCTAQPYGPLGIILTGCLAVAVFTPFLGMTQIPAWAAIAALPVAPFVLPLLLPVAVTALFVVPYGVIGFALGIGKIRGPKEEKPSAPPSPELPRETLLAFSDEFEGLSPEARRALIKRLQTKCAGDFTAVATEEKRAKDRARALAGMALPDPVVVRAVAVPFKKRK